MSTAFLQIWIPVQAASLLFLLIGSRIAGQPLLVRLGAMAHERKMKMVERVWPLTRLPGAIERGRIGVSTLILSSLIAIKSAGALVLGIIMVFWLPLAALVVPSIVMVHDPHDDSLRSRILSVAALQVTSHALASALGFVWTWAALREDRTWTDVIGEKPGFTFTVLTLTILFAVAAGSQEARTVHRNGLVLGDRFSKREVN